MNYYNPYMGFYPYAMTPTKTGIFSSLFKGGKFSLGAIMTGTQKTLNIINQTIPVIKQVSPMMKNAKTMFKVMNEFKKTDNSKQKKDVIRTTPTKNNENYQSDENITNDGPTFFI